MESLLPKFKEAIEHIRSVLEVNHFVFFEIEQEPIMSTPHLSAFVEDLTANFIRGEETISIGCALSQTSKLILIFSYYRNLNHIYQRFV